MRHRKLHFAGSSGANAVEPGVTTAISAGLNSHHLTAIQRLHFNINGYVLLEQVFSKPECTALLWTAEEMKTKSQLPRLDSDCYRVLFGPAWFDQQVLKVCMDPRLRVPAEEIIGGRARLEENEFLITSAGTPLSTERPRWHRGLRPDYGSFQCADDYHCLLTKAIVYLTDLEAGQETLVVPGSHKLMVPTDSLAPILDGSVIRSVSARAGDVLLFGETLIHSSPSAPPSHERTLLVIAYCAPYMRTWSADTDPPASFAFDLSDEERDFIYGESRYGFTGVDC